jgi:hypothetical protein
MTGNSLAKGIARIVVALGTLAGTGAVGWLIAKGTDSEALLFVLGVSGLLLLAGTAYLAAHGQLEEFVERDAKGLVAVAAVGLMIAVGARADPGTGKLADRILIWSFVVFAVGLSELFVLFVVSAIRGKIDLSRAFLDKPLDINPSPPPSTALRGQESSTEGTAAASIAEPPLRTALSGDDGKPMVSLSRLQAFAWTLVVMIIYFHRVVTNQTGELPTIPAELLMVMGISGAVYLTSKQMGARPEPVTQPTPKQDGK